MPPDLQNRVLHSLGFAVRGLVYFLMLAPAVIVVSASFTESSYVKFPPQGFTHVWYERAFNNPAFMGSLALSTKLAVFATLLSLIIGTPAAFAIDRGRLRSKQALQAFLLSPLVVPAVVLGIGLLQFLAWLGLNQSFAGLMIGHVIVTLPYVIRTLTASLVLFDRRLEEAAMNLRARPLIVMQRVTIPLLFPGFISAGVFAFVTSFGNITLSIFLGFAGAVTLPVQIFTYVEHSFDPMLAAVSALVILITLAIMAAVEKLVGIERVM